MVVLYVQIALWNINKNWRRWNEGVFGDPVYILTSFGSLQVIEFLLSLGAKAVVLTSMEHEVKPDVLVLLAKKQTGNDWLSEKNFLAMFCCIRWMCKSWNAKDSCPFYGNRRPILCSTISLESWAVAGMQFTTMLVSSCFILLQTACEKTVSTVHLVLQRTLRHALGEKYWLVVLLWLHGTVYHTQSFLVVPLPLQSR